MAFIVQNAEGTRENANAYITVEFFREYHLDRGNDLTKYEDDTTVERAIVRATDYLEGRFHWAGQRKNQPTVQVTAWPRRGARDRDGNLLEGIPLALQRACAEYAFRALTQDLNPDPGPDAAIVEKKEKLDVLETQVKYAVGVGPELPSYPVADQLLIRAGLVNAQRRELARG